MSDEAQSLARIAAALERLIPATAPVPDWRAAPAYVWDGGARPVERIVAPALALLRDMRACSAGGAVLVGVDLAKPRVVLEAAYDDELGVTAAFNLNLLTRINRELGGTVREGRNVYAQFRADCDALELRARRVHGTRHTFISLGVDAGARLDGYRELGAQTAAALNERDAARRAQRDLEADRDRLRAALGKINSIRNSIVGAQTVNWSEHVYPLVAALDEAGIAGLPYPEARAKVATLAEECDRLRAALAARDAELATAREKAVEDIIAALAAHPRDVWLVEDLVMWLRALATRGSTP